MKWVIKNKRLSKTLSDLSRKLETSSNPTEKPRSKAICTYRFRGICISQLGVGGTCLQQILKKPPKPNQTKPMQNKRLIGCENTCRSFKSYICSCIPFPCFHTHLFIHNHSHVMNVHMMALLTFHILSSITPSLVREGLHHYYDLVNSKKME